MASSYPHPIIAREGWPFLAIAILVPSLYGFGSKFIEFVATFREAREGAPERSGERPRRIEVLERPNRIGGPERQVPTRMGQARA